MALPTVLCSAGLAVFCTADWLSASILFVLLPDITLSAWAAFDCCRFKKVPFNVSQLWLEEPKEAYCLLQVEAAPERTEVAGLANKPSQLAPEPQHSRNPQTSKPGQVAPGPAPALAPKPVPKSRNNSLLEFRKLEHGRPWREDVQLEVSVEGRPGSGKSALVQRIVSGEPVAVERYSGKPGLYYYVSRSGVAVAESSYSAGEGEVLVAKARVRFRIVCDLHELRKWQARLRAGEAQEVVLVLAGSAALWPKPLRRMWFLDELLRSPLLVEALVRTPPDLLRASALRLRETPSPEESEALRRLCRETDWLRLRTVAKGEEEEEEEEPGDEALMSYCLPELMRVQLEERVARPVEDEERFNDLLAAQELVARENKEPGAEDLPSMCLSLDPLAGQPSLAGLAGLAVPQPVLAFLGGRGSGKSFLCGLVKGSSRVSNALPRTKRLRLHLQSSLSLLDSPGCAVSSWSQEASNAAEMAEYVCVVLSEDFEEQLALVQQPGSGHGLSAATQKLKFVCLNLRGCRRKEETHAVEALLARLNWRRMRIFSDSGPAEYYWTWQDLRLFLLLDARHSGEGNRVVARALASFAQHQTTSSTSKPLSELVAKCQASQSLPLPPSRLRLLSVTGKAARRLLGLEQGEERGEYVLQVAQKPDNFQSRVGRALFGPGRLLLLTGQIAMDTFQLVLPVEADNDWPTLHNPKEDSKPWILRITPNPH